MNNRKLVIGSQLFFAREGIVVAGVGNPAVGGGTVSQYYKPPVGEAIPDINWASLGEVQNFTPTPKIEETDIIAPAPGAYQRTDSIVTGRSLDLAFVLYNVSELFFESLLLGKADNEGDYAPLSATGTIRGWLKAQQYDQGDTLRNVFDVYVSGKFKAAKMENKVIMAEMDCKVLFSTLASGTVTLGA